MENFSIIFGLVCVVPCWGIVILAWLSILKLGKLSQTARKVGTGLLIVFILTPILLVAHWFAAENAESEFFAAAGRGDTAEVERRIRWGADVNVVQDNTDYTPLIVAAYGDHTDTVTAILRHHPTNLAQKDMMGDTVLQIAEKNGNKEIVRLLKAAGAKE